MADCCPKLAGTWTTPSFGTCHCACKLHIKLRSYDMPRMLGKTRAFICVHTRDHIHTKKKTERDRKKERCRHTVTKAHRRRHTLTHAPAQASKHARMHARTHKHTFAAGRLLFLGAGVSRSGSLSDELSLIAARLLCFLSASWCCCPTGACNECACIEVCLCWSCCCKGSLCCR